jgi:hypothetical protein
VTQASPSTPPWPPRAVQLAWALAAVGVSLRIIRYAANRSLWLDEAFLAESVLTCTVRQLLTEPLLHWQAAPVGFLFLEKLAVNLLGTSEYALRLVPLIAGITSVPLFAAVARRLLPPAGGLAALALFACLEPLVYYSAEVKQYAVDVACALGIVFCTLRVLEVPRNFGRLVALGALGAAAIFLSHASMFVLAAMAALAVRLAPLGIVWLSLFAVNYLLFLRTLTRHSGLSSYWAGGYMPWDASALPWLARTLYSVYTDYGSMWLPLPFVAIGATALGAAWMWRENRRALSVCTLPILLTLAAAMLHRYPFSGRLILFLVPLVILLIGAGVQAVLDLRMRAQRVIAGALIAVILGPSVGLALYYVARPGRREEIKAVLAHVREHRQPGDVLYVWNHSRVPFRYYRDRFGIGPDRFEMTQMQCIPGNPVNPTESAYAEEFGQLRGRGRVWVLLTHWAALGGPDERAVILPVLDRMGTRLETHEAKGAMVILYDLAPAGRPAPEPPPR